MPVERTLSIIKPDATRKNITGAIVARLKKPGCASSPSGARS